MSGRFGIFDVTPVVECGRYPAKAVVGEIIPITATIVREGHELPAANIVWRGPTPDISTSASMKNGSAAQGSGKLSTSKRGTAAKSTASKAAVKPPINRMRCTNPGLDAWHGEVVPTEVGLWVFHIEAWRDPLADWWHDVRIKVDVGQSADELANDFETGARLFARAARLVPKEHRALLTATAAALRNVDASLPERISLAFEDDLVQLLDQHPVREQVTRSRRYHVWVDRQRALFGSWYELFPRSDGDVNADGKLMHGTFKTAMRRLPAIADMGFDVVYIPPIHPIGTTNRKGPNNSLFAGPDDPGVPWAIGSVEGGHDAINPQLGTIDDFDAFVARTRELGMEVAMDFAIQFSPDHPWVTKHPEWFTVRPDGSVAYAENPPKKYQDIYPPNFDKDPDGLYEELRRIVQYWMDHGIRIFRCDNPHTKPLNFWHRLIADIQQTDPDVLFLAEAYAKPGMMFGLAKVGFSQSYTYFTWRNYKGELEDYAREVSQRVDWFRPNFWVNTPDVLHASLQHGGPPMFKTRAVLASMLAPSWGMYSGYELFEHVPRHEGSEEYLDSEKYQLRKRDWAAAEREGRSLAPYIQKLNMIRRSHPALQQLRTLRIHHVDNDGVMAFSKRDDQTGDTVLVVVTLDPFHVQEGTTALDMPALGFDWHERFEVHDEISGATYDWGQFNFIRLDPHVEPAHIFAIRRYRW